MTSLVYLDSSALLKRVFVEAESHSLMTALTAARQTGAQFVASALARVEVARAARTRLDRVPPGEVATGSSDAFVGVAVANVTKPILESARIIGPPVLRSLDAIHLATAISVGAAQLWTYDRRLGDVAEELGIPSFAPA